MKAPFRSLPDGQQLWPGPEARAGGERLLFCATGQGRSRNLFSPITGLTFTVDASTRKLYTANAILKQAGVKKKL
ncbi:MAG: hypothetical protein K2W86_13645 [Sphingomonas sp.]|uniref:hypothetical protein n=1 Tax=Sphingomonas sp. TaxID=28214 RepID=UPI0035A94744|nr:hypothetical protein [Sphingomonas sp.]